MSAASTLTARVAEAASALRERSSLQPAVALILGTGLGGLAREIDEPEVVEYADIPHMALSTVESHTGRFILGKLEGVPVVAMEGRLHRYEGYSLQEVTFPVRVLRALGAEVLVVSNASGGMNPLWSPGELVLIEDHINLLGDNPLVGPNDASLGVRFPDMSEAYDGELRQVTREVALELGICLRRGVYVGVPGPNLETRAEYRMLRTLGGDVVGMSTVPEVIVAVHGGMRVLGISIITDACLPDALEPATLEKILAAARAAEPDLTRLVRGVIQRLRITNYETPALAGIS